MRQKNRTQMLPSKIEQINRTKFDDMGKRRDKETEHRWCLGRNRTKKEQSLMTDKLR